jgi:hypothetical protein
VARAGFGFFYDRIPAGTYFMGVEQNFPYAGTLDYSAVCRRAIHPAESFPGVYTRNISAALLQSVPDGSLFGADRGRRDSDHPHAAGAGIQFELAV